MWQSLADAVDVGVTCMCGTVRGTGVEDVAEELIRTTASDLTGQRGPREIHNRSRAHYTAIIPP